MSNLEERSTAIREIISEIESKANQCEQVEIPLQHYFSKDVYAREIIIPKGTLVVGKIHKHQSLNILSKGKIALFSIEGAKIVEAPFTIVSPPGVKRVGYAIEECVWTTIHGTSETDLVKIEDEFIATDYDEVQIMKEVLPCLGSPQV